MYFANHLMRWLTVLTCYSAAGGTYVKPLKIFYNNTLQEQHKCTAMEIDPGHEQYIVSFTPDADSSSLLHLSVQVCEEIPSYDTQWSCSGEHLPGCIGITRPIYVWGQNSGPWVLPDDTGIPIGGESGGRFLVLQAHIRPLEKEEDHPRDYANVDLELTNERPTYETGLMVLGNTGYIPPFVKGFESESACLWASSKMALLIGYRIHTHALGYWVTGNRYRNGYWKPIAAGRPQDPENIIPTRSVTLLREGDALTARCYFKNTRPSRVYFGPNYRDEMCNLHLIYMFPFGTDRGLRFQTCAKDAQNFHLTDYFDFIPNVKVPSPKYDLERGY